MTREEFKNKFNVEMIIGNYASALLTTQQYIHSLEEQNQGLQSLLDLKQQEIAVLESKVCEAKQ